MQQALGRAVQLNEPKIQLAVGNLQRDGLIVQVVGFVVALGGVSLFHQVAGLLQIFRFLLVELFYLLRDGKQVFRFFVVTFIAMAAHAAALPE